MKDTRKSFLKSLYISGFKSIGSGQDAQTIDLQEINIIIGANGAGKTNLISFFTMLNYMMTGALKDYVAKQGFSENLLHFGSKSTPVISASLAFENEDFTNSYGFSLAKSLDSLIFTEEKLVCNGKEYGIPGGQRESHFSSNFLEHASEKALKTILSKCRAYQFHDTSYSSHIRAVTQVSQNDYLFSDGGNVAAFLYMLKNKSAEFNKYYHRILEYIRRVVPNFADFVLEPDAMNSQYIKLRWIQHGNPEYIMDASQLSDGALRFIALATLFLQPPELLPNIILIDEPELGLHPRQLTHLLL